MNSQIDKAAELIEKYEILPKAAIAKKAIPYSNIVYIFCFHGIRFPTSRR
ncbi:hypothetical protein [Clostridium formicaceticum]|nr:hypothetical protein [Clostridium formicaceticum]